MKFDSYYSSSSGNLYCVTAGNGKRLLIDPGVTWKKVQKALSYDLTNIAGCLISHEHKDHSKAVEDVLMSEIDVYASKGTFDALGVEHRKAHIIRDKESFNIDDTFNVFPFALQHDAAETLGFVIMDRIYKEDMLFVTDTCVIKQWFGLAFSIIAICCNYDGRLLRDRVDNGDCNEVLAKRLLDSHMEWHVTKTYIAESCCLDKCTEIHLLHMSLSNIDKEAVRAEFENEFMTKTFIAGKARRSKY